MADDFTPGPLVRAKGSAAPADFTPAPMERVKAPVSASKAQTPDGIPIADQPPFMEDEPGRVYGNILPFSAKADAEGNAIPGTREFAAPEFIRSPIRGIKSIGQKLTGKVSPQERADVDTGQISSDELSAMALFTSGVVGKAAARGAPATAPEVLANRQAALDAIKAAEPDVKASKIVGRRAAQDIAGGGTSAQEVIDDMAKAHSLGKPMALLDAGPNMQALAGNVMRKPGEAQPIIRNALDKRDAEALQRLQADSKAYLSNQDSAYRTSRELIAARDVESSPLYEKAMEGGSIAPLEKQFESAFDAASKDTVAAGKRVSAAQNAITQAEAKLHAAGNDVNASSGALENLRGARKELETAQKAEGEAAERKYAVLDRLRQAQEDAATGAPGAVYSPRIQQFLDDPITKAGLARGLEHQRLQSLAKNERFDPTEYAVGPEGNVVKVPNMKTLDAIKKGLDAIIESEGRDDYGRLNTRGRDVNAVRVALLGELDAINPSYAAARQSWAGHSASLDALKFGKTAMRGGDHSLSPEEITDTLAKMTAGEREFARIGLANGVMDRVKDMGFIGDEAKAVAKSVLRQEKMKPFFRTPEDADKFFDAVEYERRLFDTRYRVKGGSPTAERAEESLGDRLSGASHAVRGVAAGARGSPLQAMSHFGSAAKDLASRGDPKANASVARMLTDPKVGLKVGPDGKLQIGSPFEMTLPFPGTAP